MEGNILKYLFLNVMLISIVQNPYAQKTVMANTAMNLLYRGIMNPVDIASEGIRRENLEVYCKGFKITDSMGHYYIFISKTYAQREAYIKIRDRKNKNKTWIDSVHFRVKNIPRPIAQLGTLRPGTYNRGEIAIQNTLYAYLDGFVFDGLKFNVISYNIHAFNINNLEILHSKNTGNGTVLIRSLTAASQGQIRIEIDSIRAVLDNKSGKENDTVFLYPITYFTKGEDSDNMMAEFHDGQKRKVLRKNADYNKDSSYGNYRELKQLRDNDTTTVASRFDSAGHLIYFKRYYPDKPGSIKLDVRRTSDSMYHVRFFSIQGFCIAEGNSTQYIYDISKDSYNWPTPIDSIFWFMSYQQAKYSLMPIGQWKFYYGSGQIFIKGSFTPRPKHETEGIHCGTIDYFDKSGLWQVFDINGKIIEEKNFDKK